MIPKVNKFRLISSSALAAGYVICALAASAQESRYERFRAHNTTMTALQPAWMGPLIQSDSRLSQAIRLSVSNSYCPTQTVNYGNGHGIAVMAGTRFQFDYMQPAYVQNNSAKTKDGIGDTETQIKYRIASGNAEHGNFAVSAILAQTFPTGSHKNGAATSVYFPKLAVGKARGRFNVQPVLSGVIPTGKIAAQGRAVEWSATAQMHPSPNVWLDVEDNAAFNKGGPVDGKTQNFITPAAFYMVRRKSWKPTHSAVIFNAGMQIATSEFHFYNPLSGS